LNKLLGSSYNKDAEAVASRDKVLIQEGTKLQAYLEEVTEAYYLEWAV